MKKSRQNLLWITIPVTLALAVTGCATKKYVRNQTGIVNQRVSVLETKTKQQVAFLNAKHDADISRVDERIATTYNKVMEVASVAQQANSTADQATQMAQTNASKIEDSSKTIGALSTLAENAWNYQLIEKGDVTFALNKSELDPAAKAALDMIAQKAQAMPRSVVELQGFTDKTGSRQRNLALSRQRADAVARYLVGQNIPLREIHTIGLGPENPPASLTSDEKALEPNATPKDIRRLARRVHIRVYAPATSIAGEAARTQP